MPKLPSILGQKSAPNGYKFDVKEVIHEQTKIALPDASVHTCLPSHDETAAFSNITIRRRREMGPTTAPFTPPLPASTFNSNARRRLPARRERFSVLISMQFSVEERVEMEMRIQALKGDVVHDWHKANKISHVIVKLDEQLSFSSGDQNVCIRCSEYFVGIVNRSVIVSDRWLTENMHRSSFVDTKPYEVVGENGSETCMFSYAPNAVRKGLVSPLENYTFFMAREFIPESNMGYMQYDLLRYVTRKSAAKVVENVPDLEKLLRDIRSSPTSLKDEASAAAGRKSISFATPAKPAGDNAEGASQAMRQEHDVVVEDDDAVRVASSLSLNLPSSASLPLTPSFDVKKKLSASARKSIATTGSGTTTTSSTTRARQGGDQKVFLLAGGCLRNYAVSDDYKELAKRLNVRIVCSCYIWDSISTWTKTGFWNYVLYGDIFGNHVDRKVHHISPSFIKFNRSLCCSNSANNCGSESTTSSLSADNTEAAVAVKPPMFSRQTSSDVVHATRKPTTVNGTVSSTNSKKRALHAAVDAVLDAGGRRPSWRSTPTVDAPPAPPVMPPPEEDSFFYSNLLEDVRQTRDADYKQQRKKRRHAQPNGSSTSTLLGQPLQSHSETDGDGRTMFDAKLPVYDRYHIPPPLQRNLPKHLYRNDYFAPGYESFSKWLEVPQSWTYKTIVNAKKVEDLAKYGSAFVANSNIMPSKPSNGTAGVSSSASTSKKKLDKHVASVKSTTTVTPVRSTAASPPPQIIAEVTPLKKAFVVPTTVINNVTAETGADEDAETVETKEEEVSVKNKPVAAVVAAQSKPRRSYRGPVGLEAVDVAVVTSKKKLSPVAPTSSPQNSTGPPTRKRARLMT